MEKVTEGQPRSWRGSWLSGRTGGCQVPGSRMSAGRIQARMADVVVCGFMVLFLLLYVLRLCRLETANGRNHGRQSLCVALRVLPDQTRVLANHKPTSLPGILELSNQRVCHSVC